MIQFIQNIDLRLFSLFYSLSLHSQTVDFIVIFLAVYLAFVLPLVFLVLLYRLSRPLSEKVWIFCVALFAGVFAKYGVTEVVRLFYHRPRPFVAHSIHPLFTESSYSFPSGHASFFFAFSFAIYLYNKKWGTWFLIATVLMTISRVISGVHYPSDILGGLAVGVIVAYLTFEYLGPIGRKIINKFV